VNQRQQLDAALAEQRRRTDRFARSVGTSGELSAYTHLRESTVAVNECDHPHNGTPRRDRVERFFFSLLCESTAPGVARAELERRLEGALDEDTLATVLLLASETVTNAVLHGCTPEHDTVDIEVDLSGDRLWIGVTNAGPAVDHVPKLPEHHAPGGRGLFLVEALSRAWGTGHASGVTSVWCEVDRRMALAA
jgi:anti-sigma regulatory factor (Ser/Thr protein kinase)